MTEAKAKLYTTAVAKLACPKFQAGEIVEIQFDWRNPDGTLWFLVTATDRGPLERPIAYAEHQLERFVI